MHRLLESARREGLYYQLRHLIEELRDRGWSDERLSKNDLLAADPESESAAREYARFWRTIVRLARELRELDLAPIFIKCVREYRYRDANVDTLVPQQEMSSVEDHLCASSWARPRPWDTLEQMMIERAKRKLPSRDSSLVAAHLYGAVSWRYQGDIGLLRTDGRNPDPRHLVRVSSASFAGREATGDGESLWIPAPEAELVLQAAHVVFENFRITVGEAIHFQLLQVRHPSAWNRARALADQHGCSRALDLVRARSERLCSNIDRLAPEDHPQTLPFTELRKAFRERTRHLLANRRVLSAVNELGTSVGFFTLVSTIRKVRRWRRGREDYR